MSGSRQWIRNASIVVANASGQGIELGELAIEFKVTHEVAGETPKQLLARIFNVAPTTAKAIMAPEFTRVILKVGYGNPAVEAPRLSVIFDGDIKQVRVGRANATDTYVDVLAGSMDGAYNNAFITKAIAAGYSQSDLNDAVQQVFTQFGVEKGMAGPFKDGQAPRGRVMFGLARNYAREIAYTNQTTWNVVDRVYDQVPVTEYKPGQAVEINSATGMIGLPQQTIDGIMVRTLLNPLVKPNQLVKINNKSIQAFLQPLGFKDTSFPASFDADGTYKVVFIDHEGQTRGQAWYSEFICVATDSSAPATNAIIKAVGYNP